MTEEAGDRTAKGQQACAICGKPVDARYAPFCSRRCADIDLGRWLKGGYAIPARPEAPGEEEDGVEPPAPDKPDPRAPDDR